VRHGEDSRGDKRNATTHLLKVEDVMVEIILQLLVCIVDTKLLKAVGLKVLKPKNVQDTDGQTLEKRTNGTLVRRRKGNAYQLPANKIQQYL